MNYYFYIDSQTFSVIAFHFAWPKFGTLRLN
jgi:hypothetical protein